MADPLTDDVPAKVTGITIRSAVVEDCEGIYRLIRELANFQGYPNGPELTVERLREDGFPRPDRNRQTAVPVFSSLVVEATSTSTLVGYALFFPIYSTWKGKGLYLEDIYVQPEYRKLGVGNKLFASVCKFALDDGCTSLRLSVLEKNIGAKKFYEQRGFQNLTADEGWETGKFGMDDLVEIVNNEA